MRKKKHPTIKKNDKVVVLAGKEKGKIGTVLKLDSDAGRAVVEKVNMVKRHTRAGGKSAQGGIIEKEAPIHISNLMLIDPSSGAPTRIGRKKNSKGKLVRYSKKSGEEIK